MVHHPGLGVAVLTEDPNGVQTTVFHDRFGRVRRVEPQGGTAASISYQSGDCKTAAAAEKGTCVAVTQDDGAKHVAYSDERGRTWEVGDRGFDGEGGSAHVPVVHVLGIDERHVVVIICTINLEEDDAHSYLVAASAALRALEAVTPIEDIQGIPRRFWRLVLG